MIAVTDLEIRQMTAADLATVTSLEQRAYSQPWNAKIFADELAQPTRTYLVISDDLAVRGYGGLMVVGDEAHITTVVVDPDRRADKLGTRLMLGLTSEALRRAARSMTLEVRSSNVAAQRLYRRFGMAPVGVRKQYYQDEDAMIMWVRDIDGAEFAARITDIEASLT